MLALLGVVMLVGRGAAPERADETPAGSRPEAVDRIPAASLALRLPPVGRDVLVANAPSAAVVPTPEKDDDALGDPRPPAVATSLGQAEMPDSAVPDSAVPDSAVVESRARITFYSCQGPRGGYCGAMSSGKTVYEGAAACGPAFALGERVGIDGDPTGRVYVCEDRGWLAPTQVDVFWYREEDGRAWSAQVGGWAKVRREP